MRVSREELRRASEAAAAYHVERRRWYAVRESDGVRVVEGDELPRTARGHRYIFKGVAAFPDGGRSGKVAVHLLDGDGEPVSQGLGAHGEVFYPQVFGLRLRRLPDAPESDAHEPAPL